MPQPIITGSHRIVRFGGLAQPNGQGILAQVDLNDLGGWCTQDDFVSDLTQQLTFAQQVWRSKAAILGRNFDGAVPIKLPMEFRETPSRTLGAALGQIALAGEQQLTFDNATCLLATFMGTAGRQSSFRWGPLRWTFDLMFLAREPWFRDLATTTAPNALALSSGSATTFNVTYGGSVWPEPVWKLTIPAGNAAPIASFVLSNVTSGETLTLTFPGNLPASTAATITIDWATMSATDANGVSYDLSGAIPTLYGPSGQVNAMSATLTPASGTATGCTLTGTFTNRWIG